MTATRKVSRAKRREIIAALGRGTVPRLGLDLFAVGMERFEKGLDEELAAVTTGGSGFKAVRGEYGSGKTFFARWLAERAKRMRMATSEIQISDTETPLYKTETVYRRLIGALSSASSQHSQRSTGSVASVNSQIGRTVVAGGLRGAKPLSQSRPSSRGSQVGSARGRAAGAGVGLTTGALSITGRPVELAL